MTPVSITAMPGISGIAGAIYLTLIALAATVAIFTKKPARRKAALEVLFVLMWRRRTNDRRTARK